jgi:MFS family permease
VTGDEGDIHGDAVGAARTADGRGAVSSSRALSRDRNFARLWGGEAISGIGSQITTIAMPLLALSLTGSAASAGLVGVARSLGYPLATVPSGVLADRIDRRRLMIACALIRVLAIGSVPLVLALGQPPLWQLLLATFVDAALFATASVAERGLLTQIVPAAALAEAVTLNEARSASAVVAGPPLGGALFGITRGLPFLADAASFLVVAWTLRGLRVAGREEPAPRVATAAMRGIFEEAREGFRWLWDQPFLRAGSILYAAANVTIVAVELLALLIAKRHGASAAAIGGAFAIVGVGLLAGAAIANPLRARLSARWAVLAEPWFYALLTPLFLLAHTPVVIGLLVAVMFLPLTLSSSTIVGRRLAVTPDHLRSRVTASATFMSGSLTWLGPLAIGTLVQYAGATTAVLALTAWSFMIAVAASLAPGLRSIPDVVAPRGT